MRVDDEFGHVGGSRRPLLSRRVIVAIIQPRTAAQLWWLRASPWGVQAQRGLALLYL